MNKDRVNGTTDQLVGSAKRKAGEMTGDSKLQVKGIAQQGKGILEEVWGKVKDAVNEANDEANEDSRPNRGPRV
jgi:uncharacterized protein YjbJ (UPF0337 family)